MFLAKAVVAIVVVYLVWWALQALGAFAVAPSELDKVLQAYGHRI